MKGHCGSKKSEAEQISSKRNSDSHGKVINENLNSRNIKHDNNMGAESNLKIQRKARKGLKRQRGKRLEDIRNELLNSVSSIRMEDDQKNQAVKYIDSDVIRNQADSTRTVQKKDFIERHENSKRLVGISKSKNDFDDDLDKEEKVNE